MHRRVVRTRKITSVVITNFIKRSACLQTTLCHGKNFQIKINNLQISFATNRNVRFTTLQRTHRMFKTLSFTRVSGMNSNILMTQNFLPKKTKQNLQLKPPCVQNFSSKIRNLSNCNLHGRKFAVAHQEMARNSCSQLATFLTLPPLVHGKFIKMQLSFC